MPELKCPVCGGPLREEGRTLRCAGGHSYDMARQGYVNLLMSNRSSAKRHGDDRLMVRSRRDFLDAGWYDCLRDAVCRLAVRHCAGERVELLDAGCGEGWYTAGVKAALEAAGKPCAALGVDISREAVTMAAKRKAGLTLAVAGVNALPVADGSCDLLLNIFAPHDDREFRRVLRPGGVLIKAVPRERHLFGLKAAVYERPYENGPALFAPEGFALLDREDVDRLLVLEEPGAIADLFMMTPYYYKTSAADQQKLLSLSRLETELSFAVFALRRG